MKLNMQMMMTMLVCLAVLKPLSGSAQSVGSLKLDVLNVADSKQMDGDGPSCGNKIYRMLDGQWIATIKSYPDDVHVVSGAIFDSKRVRPGKQAVHVKVSGEYNGKLDLSVWDNGVNYESKKQTLRMSGGVALSEKNELDISGDLYLVKEDDKYEAKSGKRYQAHLSLTSSTYNYQKNYYKNVLFDGPVWVVDQCRTNDGNQVFRSVPMYQKIIGLVFVLINGGH